MCKYNSKYKELIRPKDLMCNKNKGCIPNN